MYPYYNQWYGWTRANSGQPYVQNYYQDYYQNFPIMNSEGYAFYPYQEMYSYQDPYQASYQVPYMNGYGYQGYTGDETTTTKTAFQAGAIPKGVMNYFQDEEGQLDFDKMMSTTGQMMKTVQQVSPLVKGIGSFVKGIK